MRAAFHLSPAAQGRAGSWTFPLRRPPALRLNRLLAHEVPELIDLLDEEGVLEDVAAGLVELGIDDGLDAAGPSRHHGDPVRQIHGLLHVVRYEDHRLR